MSDKVMKVLADETGGKSYKAHKYGLDHAERPFIDYGEDSIVWKKTSETHHHRTYVNLEQKSIDLANREEQLLTYFLDGSRRVYKVDDIASTDVADFLSEKYDIAVRSGIHCAPLLHQYLGTVDVGLTRASLSVQNTTREIRCFLSAVYDLIKD